jgi:hypothetical protein
VIIALRRLFSEKRTSGKKNKSYYSRLQYHDTYTNYPGIGYLQVNTRLILFFPEVSDFLIKIFENNSEFFAKFLKREFFHHDGGVSK